MGLQTAQALADEALVEVIVHNLLQQVGENIHAVGVNVLLDVLVLKAGVLHQPQEDLFTESHLVFAVIDVDPFNPDGDVKVELGKHICRHRDQADLDGQVLVGPHSPLLGVDLQVVTGVKQALEVEVEVELETLRNVGQIRDARLGLVGAEV